MCKVISLRNIEILIFIQIFCKILKFQKEFIPRPDGIIALHGPPYTYILTRMLFRQWETYSWVQNHNNQEIVT